LINKDKKKGDFIMKSLKSKIMLVIVFALVLAFVIPAVVSFAYATEYTVTFETGIGPDVESIKVAEGGLVSADLVPDYDEMDVVEGYEFWGWYKDSNYEEEFEFEEDTITENTTIYAWYRKILTVEYVCNVEGVEIESEEILEGMMAYLPYVELPEDDENEYVMIGMFKDANYTERYSPDEPITENTTLYLKFENTAANELIEEIHVNIANPVVGNSTDTPSIENIYGEDSGVTYVWKKQTGLLEITIPEGEHWHIYDGDLGGGMMYSMYIPMEIVEEIELQGYEPKDLFGHLYMQIIIVENTTDEETGNVRESYKPFIGTFEKGELYTVYVFLQSDEGYNFSDECKVYVNDEELEEDAIKFVTGHQIEFVVDLPAVMEYKILDGANQTHVIDEDGNLAVRANGELEELVALLVDDEKIDITNPEIVELTEGSTIATLKLAYLNTLAVGEHTLTFVYPDGDVLTTFTIAKAEEVVEETITPNTGDNIVVYVVLFAIACCGIVIISKKHK